jgi:hypothetical protein
MTSSARALYQRLQREDERLANYKATSLDEARELSAQIDREAAIEAKEAADEAAVMALCEEAEAAERE